MPRSSKGTAAARRKKATTTIKLDEAEGRDGDEVTVLKAPDPYVEKQGLFEFVVLTFVGLLPGQEGYEREKDKLMIGFRYGSKTPPSWMPSETNLTDITAYDFLTDPKTGLRAGQDKAPHGAANTHLGGGISDWTDLPPLYVWKEGMWLTEALRIPGFDFTTLPTWMQTKVERNMAAIKGDEKSIPSELFTYYLTSGEGSIGNALYRVYELPSTECGNNSPHHPLMWKEDVKRSKTSPSNAHKGESWRPEAKAGASALSPSWRPGGGANQSPVTKPVEKKVTIPQGVRLRCPDCGHWFSYQDLITHSGLCGDPEKTDWAIMCITECGCMTLDDVTKPKSGFPRPKKATVKKTTTTKSKEVAVVAASAEAPVQ